MTEIETLQQIQVQELRGLVILGFLCVIAFGIGDIWSRKA